MKRYSAFVFQNPLAVIGVLLVASFLIMTLLDAFGLYSLTARNKTVSYSGGVAENTEGELPVRIVIPRVDIDKNIQIPHSTDIHILDNALRLGPVYYPGSGLVGVGNMFLFGHSSRLSVVRNDAYKAFNDIEQLQVGDEIFVYTSDNERHVYVVETVTLVSAEEALVDFSQNKAMLTLSTCNTFGEKQERFVVEAAYGGVR